MSCRFTGLEVQEEEKDEELYWYHFNIVTHSIAYLWWVLKKSLHFVWVRHGTESTAQEKTMTYSSDADVQRGGEKEHQVISTWVPEFPSTIPWQMSLDTIIFLKEIIAYHSPLYLLMISSWVKWFPFLPVFSVTYTPMRQSFFSTSHANVSHSLTWPSHSHSFSLSLSLYNDLIHFLNCEWRNAYASSIKSS